MSRRSNGLIMAAIVLLTVLPLWLVKPSTDGSTGETVALFGGADDQARQAITKIAPDYQSWFEPLFAPASSEIASLLFALQAAIGAGVIGYWLGAAVTRDKCREQAKRQSSAPDTRAD